MSTPPKLPSEVAAELDSLFRPVPNDESCEDHFFPDFTESSDLLSAQDHLLKASSLNQLDEKFE
jgi:hypothetical protein